VRTPSMYETADYQDEEPYQHAHLEYSTLRRSPDRTKPAPDPSEPVNLHYLAEKLKYVGECKGLHWKRHPIRGGNTKYPGGYTGWVQQPPAETHILDDQTKKIAIRGYTGFRPNQGTVIGVPILPSVEEQEGKERCLLGPHESFASRKREAKAKAAEAGTSLHRAGKNMDLLERYTMARMNILDRGQTQESLLAQVQAKFSSRVNSYAEQYIHLSKLFEAFDVNGDQVLDEDEFRTCMERMNVQFDDFQMLALFSYFDTENVGTINWKSFAKCAMVLNPRGGTAILPNPIIRSYKL
jgi:EF-hand domain pair